MKRALFLLLAGFMITGVAIAFLLWTQSQSVHSHNAVRVLGEDSSNLSAYTSLAEDFHKQANTEVLFDAVTFGQLGTQAANDLKSGGGKYAVILQYNFSLAPYVENNWVAPVKEVYSPTVIERQHFDTNVFKNALYETCYYYSDPRDKTSPPAQFGFPFAANTMLLVWNKEMFNRESSKEAYQQRYGKPLAVPRTWDEYIQVAEFFTQDGEHGVCIQGASGGWLYYELCNYLFSMGTGTTSKKYGWEQTKNYTINTPENLRTLEYYQRLYRCSSGDYFGVDAAKQVEHMLQGKTAMAIVWSDFVPTIERGRSNLQFGYSPIPGDKSGLAGGAFYINRRSMQIENAAEFVLFAMQEHNQQKLIEKGLCSCLKSAYTPETILKVPYANALSESLERGVFMFEAGADSALIQEKLTHRTQEFIRGSITAEDALRTVHDELQAALNSTLN